MTVKKIDKSNYKYYGKYKQPNGIWKNYYKSGFTTMKAAKKAEEAFLLSVQNVDVDITFNELVSMCNERKSITIKESTIYSHNTYYTNHLKDYFGNVKISKINASMIETWLIEMSKKKTSTGNDYSVQTINNAKSVLSSYLTYAEKLDLIQYNPCRKVSNLKRPNEISIKNNQEENFWELKEFKTFISFVDDEYWNLIFSFLFETGVREGELFALQWKDIDTKSQTVEISKSITYKTQSRGYRITSPKNSNSYRTIDISNSLSERIEKHLSHEIKKDGFVFDFFVFGDIEPLARTTLARYLDKYIKKSGVKRITPHGFRHSHATFLIERGVDDSLIADRLGHTVNILRKTYAHIYKSMRADVKNKLNELYNF